MREDDRIGRTASSMAAQLDRVIGERAVEEAARATGFMQRKRKVSPVQLLLACLSALGTGPVAWLADILRRFNRLSGQTVRYKPFHNQLRKAAFAEFLRRVLVEVLSALSRPVLRALPDSKLVRFRDIIVHDGTSLALKDGLAKQWPGRFNKVSPAAVELHVTMSALDDGPLAITLAPDKEAERQFAPPADELKGCLLLEDRGYQSRKLFRQFCANDVAFVVRGTSNIRPIIRQARDHQGVRRKNLRYLEGQPLSWSRLPRRNVDLDIEWTSKSDSVYRGRIVVFYKRGARNTKTFTYLHTNLDREQFCAKEVGQLYRLRWQIELLFKQFKSHANLHKFDTAQPAIAEGLLWASLIVAVLQRRLAHNAEHALQLELSTERVAKVARLVLDDILEAVMLSRARLRRAISDAFVFIEHNARRAHPKRDRKTGRLALGLSPIVCTA